MNLQKEQLNIYGGKDLEEFVKASGGVKQAATLILNITSNIGCHIPTNK